MSPWGLIHIVPLQLSDLESLYLDQGLDIPIQVTTLGNRSLQRSEPVLPSLYPGIVAQAVFVEIQTAIRLHHTTDLFQRPLHIPNAVQRLGTLFPAQR